MLDHLIGDRYRVLRKLGEGGMAIVYLALDEKLGRNVAIKVLRDKFENHGEIRTRFQHEARAISAFDHPNILKVYDYSGQNSQRMWIVTEVIHGRNLGQIVETAPGGWLHPVIACCIVREICKALTLAHNTGIVHRDVKPDNVMITQQGIVKLMDFGIAKIQASHSMTQTGMFMGSPSYMSPEQVRGRDIDHRSDIYSLGVLFYELVTGKLPFSGQSTADVAIKILEGQFQHPKFLKEHLPNELNDLIVTSMANEASNRPRSADTVAGVIDQFLERNGFETSTAELELCFRDPKGYGERLARLIQQTIVVAMPTQLLRSDQRMNAATKLPGKDNVQSRVRAHNEHAVDHPKPFIPATVAIDNRPLPNPTYRANAVPPPPLRRDHALPPRSLPHVTKKLSAPTQMIVDHLPERRDQQRLEQTNAAADMQRGEAARDHRLPQPPQRVNQRPRPPRSLPRVPQRIQHHVRYVVHREAFRSGSSSFFSRLAGFLIVAAIAFVTFNIVKDSGMFDPPQTTGKKTTKSRPLPPPPEPTRRLDVSKTEPSIQTPIQALPSFDPPSFGKSKTQSEKSNKPTTSKTSDKKPTQVKEYANKTQPSPLPTKRLAQKVDPKPESTREPVGEGTKQPNVAETKPVPIPTPKPEEKATPEVIATPARFQISVSPAAEIYVDGRRVGTSNDAGTSSEWIDVTPGTHRIELRRKGHSSKIETVTFKAGDKRRLGPVILAKEGQKSVPSKYRLTLMTSAVPANVTLTNADTQVVTTLVLKDASQTLTLDRGTYDVVIERGGDAKKRRVDLTGNNTQITFSAEFKEGQH